MPKRKVGVHIKIFLVISFDLARFYYPLINVVFYIWRTFIKFTMVQNCLSLLWVQFVSASFEGHIPTFEQWVRNKHQNCKGKETDFDLFQFCRSMSQVGVIFLCLKFKAVKQSGWGKPCSVKSESKGSLSSLLLKGMHIAESAWIED